jgi:hypothetical protein
MPLPTAVDMFGDAESPVEIAGRFEAYKEALNKSASSPMTPGPDGAPVSEAAEIQKALGSDLFSKALSPELLASVRESIAQADLGKDLLVAGPGSTGGLVQYDLEAPAKLLAPRPTPLRNRIARRKGVGVAHQFKRVTGFTGSGTGGVGVQRPGITETGQTTWGGQTLRRPPVISYAGDQVTVPYIEFGASDTVSWRAQFAGQGYQDIRQLSQSSVLYSSMLQEERVLLGGRGTASGFAGALTAPVVSSTSIAARAPIAGEVGLSGITTNVYVLITSECVFGESVVSAALNVAATNGQVIDVGVTTGVSLPAGATGFRVYVASAASQPANTLFAYYGRSGGASITISGGALPAPVLANNPPLADNSATATEYDGILTYCTSANAGYVKRINSGLSTGNPGNEFNVAFASMYDAVKADPDEILANGNDRKQLSDLLKTSSSSNYRITIDNSSEAHGAQLGAMVTAIQNEVTGKIVDVTVHPWLPQGNMPIVSWTLPLPDSNVSDVFSVFNVQDYQMIEWPVNQLSYDVSSYWFGTFACFAPAWCGAITGISKV